MNVEADIWYGIDINSTLSSECPNSTCTTRLHAPPGQRLMIRSDRGTECDDEICTQSSNYIMADGKCRCDLSQYNKELFTSTDNELLLQSHWTTRDHEGSLRVESK